MSVYTHGEATAHAARVNRLREHLEAQEDALIQRLDAIDQETADAEQRMQTRIAAAEMAMERELESRRRQVATSAAKLEREAARVNALRKAAKRRQDTLTAKMGELEAAIVAAERRIYIADQPSTYGGREGLEAATREMYPKQHGLKTRQNSPECSKMRQART